LRHLLQLTIQKAKQFLIGLAHPNNRYCLMPMLSTKTKRKTQKIVAESSKWHV